MIDQRTVQRIIESANIVDVVSDFVSLRKAGADYKGLCPFHTDRRPSFSVSPARNICKCFSCGEGGSPLHFIMKHEQLTYVEALRYLAKKYGITIEEREQTNEEKEAANERESLFLVNEFAENFFVEQLNETEEGRQIALSYFKERGIKAETIKKFGLGYSPEIRTALTDEAVKKGYKLERLVQVGLSVQYDEKKPAVDRFRGRVIFPVRNLGGKYVAFGGRIMGKSEKLAKYLNSPESSIYSKSRELYGLYQAKYAISKADKCYLVEGYTDVLSMHQAGLENVVSSSGTALTIEQIRLLKRFSQNITVLYDGDAAGIKAALRGIDLLLEEGLNIKVVLLPEGEDPDSFAQSHTNEELQKFLDEAETDFIHFKINLYQEEMQSDPLKRAELIRDILRSIALIPDSIKRSVLVQSSATELRMSEQLLVQEVQKFRKAGVRAGGYVRANTNQQPSNPTPIATKQEDFTEGNNSANESKEQDSPSAPNPLEIEDKKSLQAYEVDLASFVVGNMGQAMLLYYPSEEEEIEEDESLPQYEEINSAIAYIYEVLIDYSIFDELSEIFKALMQEALSFDQESGQKFEDYLLAHREETLRRLATDVISANHLQEQRGGSKLPYQEIFDENDPRAKERKEAYEEKLERQALIERGHTVNKLLDNLQLHFLKRNIIKVQQELRTAQKEGDKDKIKKILLYLNEMNKLKVELAQALGGRTIQR